MLKYLIHYQATMKGNKSRFTAYAYAIIISNSEFEVMKESC